MASPITPGSGRALSIMPGSRVVKSPLSDETIWKRLKEAGFDEESVKKRDKATLIAYIAKLEAELFEHQHHMGLLILERKELASKYEQIKASAEASEIMQKRDQAAHASALAEAKKREDGLKKSLGVEKECIASIEKALHEMHAESAETKVAAESRLAEARIMIEDAQKKFAEAEVKFHAAKSLQTEASLFQRTAERKLQEVEAREEDLSRRTILFKNDCDTKEKEITLERQSLRERQKIIQQEHERLLDGQASLNQRQEYIFSRSQELNQLEKGLEASRVDIERERKALKDEKSKLELTLASLSKREEAITDREVLLSKKEQQLLVSQEKLANKESDEIRKAIASHETVLRTKKSEFEAELEIKRKMAADEIEMKRRAWELKEMDINQREDLIREREHDFDVRSRILAEKEKDVTEKSNLIEQREKSATDKRNQVDCAKEKLLAMRSETHELSNLESKLKEELDLVRAQKLELMANADRLQVEKAKFETEWELIDEKREELKKEAMRVHEEREAFLKFLKDERDSLRRERDVMRERHNKDVESLNREREDFMNKMVSEHSDWFNRIQQERAELLLGIETQKRELENFVEKRREELESSLKEREEAFEREKRNQFQHINALKERAEKELEQATLEMKRLDAERKEIKLDRERREREWAELNKSIEELKVQRHKLKQQRELLHADRKEIHAEIEELKKLGDLKAAVDNMMVAQMQCSIVELSRQKAYERKTLKEQTGRHELSNLESKLKEELDLVRAQKLELMANADRLQVEKAKFETEWELIDEKREELKKEAMRVHEEREAFLKFLKDERDSLRRERDVMRERHNKDVESLNREREDFMNKMVSEHSDWFNRIQQERAELLLGIETQKRELENFVEKRREELESSLKEREEAFEREKRNQFQHINALKERAEKELEQATLEMKRLDAERKEIKLDRERREREWAELNKSIEELKVQRHKLKQQRELLHADRKEIHAEIEELKKLGDLKAAVDNMMVAQMQCSIVELSRQKAYERKTLKEQTVMQNSGSCSVKNRVVADNGNGFNSPMSKPDSASPSSARFSWIKRCRELIFKNASDMAQMKPEERSLISDREDVCLTSAGKLVLSHECDGQKYKQYGRKPLGFDGEPKVTVEVPSEDEVIKGIHHLESGLEKSNAEKSLVSEEGIQAGRKRRVDSSPSHGTKKRRQTKDASVIEEEDRAHSVNSTEPNSLPDQPVSLSYDQSQGGADNALVVDKITEILEETFEKKVVVDSSNLGNTDHLQDIVAESMQGIPQSGGMCSLASASGENGGSGDPVIVQEAHLGKVSQVTKPYRPMKDVSEGGTKLEDNVVPKLDENEKIGMRTRSKQKL
ncbi:hypothetical protein GOBAR_AA09554 [Gossypium barbadense]|uniref:Protein CROWDED NUCLEI 4 n=1 Tax=Gossypium barbadense TaxID=3634 RepID=A0A2P5Y665_GOSBA|nr:hypothetical protein GOBAR_AA09554 [Gossypium barbadense]